MNVTPRHRRWICAAALLALLAALAYWPALRLPFLEDDYPHLARARFLGAPAEWHDLARSVFRYRATSEWLMWAGYTEFGLRSVWYHAVGILLHALNALLVYAAVRACRMGELALWAAAFFAIAEGHQEAIMWFSASSELLLFLFGMGAMVAWLRFVTGGSRAWYAAAIPLYALALISKESAPVFAALFFLPLLQREWRRRAVWWLPLAAMAGAAVAVEYLFRAGSFRFSDQSFSLSAPVWRIWPEGLARLFWIWGVAGAAAVAAWGSRRQRAALLRAALWSAVALIPYCFLTYSFQIPSRQTYLASGGLALAVAAGFESVRERFHEHRRLITALICMAVLLHNLGILWVRKRAQFLERARPTEELIAFERRVHGPIYIACFPRPPIVAEDALLLETGLPHAEIVWTAQDARTRGVTALYCYGSRQGTSEAH